MVFDIQRCSLHDGPGIRTTVFLAGCNLRCRWCHNPEGFSIIPKLSFHSAKCIGCGKCLKACPNGCHISAESKHIINWENCVSCGECVKKCFSGALEMTAKMKTVEEVMKTVLFDLPFYKNEGGMTVSGGECMLQPDFVAGLLKTAKENGINTAVDTAGNVSPESFSKVLPYTDLYLYDLKAMNSELHKKGTGVYNERILENLKILSAAGANIIIRIPVISDFNDTQENMKNTAEFLSTLRGIVLVELLPFHALGGGKYESLGMEFPEKETIPPQKEHMMFLSSIFNQYKIPSKIS